MNQANGSFHRREGRHRDFLERIEEIRKYFMIIIRWHFNGAFMACHRLHLVHYDCGNYDGITVLPVCGIYSAHYWKKIMWREQQFCAILKCEYMFEDRGLEIHDRRIQRLYYSYKKDTGKRGGL